MARRSQPRLDKAGYSDTYRPASIDLLDIGRDTVVVVRGDSWTEDTFGALRAALRPDVLLINLPEGDTLENLDEEQMLAAGWVRADDPLISHGVKSESPPE